MPYPQFDRHLLKIKPLAERYNKVYIEKDYVQLDTPVPNDCGIDEALMEAANIYSGERVQVVDNTNGARLETYVIPGKRGSGCICINGAAAHLVNVGDTVIIMAYALMTPEEAKSFKPAIVFPNNNKLDF